MTKKEYHRKIIKVISGNTIVVDRRIGNAFLVKLDGVPKRGGEKQRIKLRNLLHGKTVRILHI